MVGKTQRGGVGSWALASSRPNPMVRALPLFTKDIATLDINNWFGLVGPAGLPPDIAAGLGKLFLDAVNDPGSAPPLASRGVVALPQDAPPSQAPPLTPPPPWSHASPPATSQP